MNFILGQCSRINSYTELAEVLVAKNISAGNPYIM